MCRSYAEGYRRCQSLHHQPEFRAAARAQNGVYRPLHEAYQKMARKRAAAQDARSDQHVSDELFPIQQSVDPRARRDEPEAKRLWVATTQGTRSGADSLRGSQGADRRGRRGARREGPSGGAAAGGPVEARERPAARAAGGGADHRP